MRLYNTLTRSLEEFVPRDPEQVGVYACGPTVYDYTHVGHLRPALLGDVLVRWLRRKGYRVRYVVNFTDVDDRIIERARQEGVPFRQYAERYIEDYLENMRAFGLDQVDLYVRATDHIPQMIEIVEGLVAKGHAYVVDGDVYFDVRSDPDYGRLSGRSLEEMLAGARVRVDERKRHPADFALWKAAKPGEPAWPSPWGPGRPGWHIECSAMTRTYLGHGFDLHLGGEDLVFPHHENEMAQSECFAGEAPLARFWLHNAMVEIADEKMSKSLGNIVALRDLRGRVPAGALRLFLLSVHYRKPMAYSEEGLAEAERAWRRLANAREALFAALAAAGPAGPGGEMRPGGGAPSDGRAQAAPEAPLAREAQRAAESFQAAMDDDLNTPLALAALFDLARQANAALHAREAERAPVGREGGGGEAAGGVGGEAEPARAPASPGAPEGAREALARLDELGGLLGLWGPEPRAPRADDRAERLLRILLQLRDEARQARDWNLADRIRDDLESVGVLVEDTPRGTRWRWRS
ncbi:MAG: cysteine--tRNA ligase [Clostridia bacterium]|nr:cysteine--tRNA ligase [Clostridia bacterium]